METGSTWSRPFTPAQQRAFLRAIAGDRLAALYAAMIDGHLRPGEALALCWGDVDLAAGTARVGHSLRRVAGEPRLEGLKMAESRRTVVLSAATLAALRAQSDGLSPPPGAFIFTGPDAAPLDVRAVSRGLRELLSRAGLPPLRLHDLRHATRGASAGR